MDHAERQRLRAILERNNPTAQLIETSGGCIESSRHWHTATKLLDDEAASVAWEEQILPSLDTLSLVRAAAACRTLKTLARSDRIWLPKLKAYFAGLPLPPPIQRKIDLAAGQGCWQALASCVLTAQSTQRRDIDQTTGPGRQEMEQLRQKEVQLRQSGLVQRPSISIRKRCFGGHHWVCEQRVQNELEMSEPEAETVLVRWAGRHRCNTEWDYSEAGANLVEAMDCWAEFQLLMCAQRSSDCIGIDHQARARRLARRMQWLWKSAHDMFVELTAANACDGGMPQNRSEPYHTVLRLLNNPPAKPGDELPWVTEPALRHWIRDSSSRLMSREIGVATLLSGAMHGGTVDVFPVECEVALGYEMVCLLNGARISTWN